MMMGRRWEKDRVARDGAATKMSTTWKDIFSKKDESMHKLEKEREDKKAERYDAFLVLQRERMDLIASGSRRGWTLRGRGWNW